jgi:hypothetical protein
MPHDISEDIYRYLARDWGHSNDRLSNAKIRQLKRDVPVLRESYQRDREIPYNKAPTRRAYLASFAARYAYILYGCLELVRDAALDLLRDWHNSDAVVCLVGGGPGSELFGLVDWLYQNGIRPKYLHVILLDREGFWRSFHSNLFVEILGSRFRKTRVLPSYEKVEFPVSKRVGFDRQSVDYSFQQTSLLAEARLLSVVNCLSEIPDKRGIECHVRFLSRIAWNAQLVICADSAAKKRRSRMEWLQGHFENDATVHAQNLFTGIHTFECDWLKTMSENSQRIFNKTQKPIWLHSFKRWVNIARTAP